MTARGILSVMAILNYRRHLDTVPHQCERCGFIPQDLCQLEIHHRNGKHSDNEPDNFEVLCCNCHRIIEVYRKRKWTKPMPRVVESVAPSAWCEIRYIFRRTMKKGTRGRRISAIPV